MDEQGARPWVRAMGAMARALEEMERFDQLGAPPEPSTPAERASWAALSLGRMIRARQDLLGAAHALPAAPEEALAQAACHALEIARARGQAYARSWLAERGVAWREMERPQPEWGGLSWAQLLPIEALDHN